MTSILLFLEGNKKYVLSLKFPQHHTTVDLDGSERLDRITLNLPQYKNKNERTLEEVIEYK